MTPTKPEDVLVERFVREGYANFLESLCSVDLAVDTRSGASEVPTYPRQLMEASARVAITTLLERERRFREALREIKKLKPEKIGDSGFSTGPKLLLDQAQRIARAALTGMDK